MLKALCFPYYFPNTCNIFTKHRRMSNFRPAGFSDDEDEDDFDFSSDYNQDPYRNQVYLKEISESKENVLYNALREGDIQAMKCVLDDGFNVDEPLIGGWSGLMHACSLGLFPLVEFFITRGANVNFNKELFTPLMALCKSSSLKEEELAKCMVLLLDKDANINATDRNASTALMYACADGHAQLVRQLVDLKCDVNVQDTEGWSALFHAVNGGYEEIVHMLIEAKARVDLIDRRRRSAYELAMLKGFEQIGELVCSKKERRRLLAAAENIEDIPECKIKDPVEELMAQLPNPRAKNSSGFSSDVSKLLWSMGLSHLSKQFTAKNVQLNEFLLITDERLKELGVRFSVHRQRILNHVRKFHLHPWNKASLGLKPRNQQILMDDAVKIMCNIVKHLHVLDATINYVRLHQPIPIRTEIFTIAENAAHQLNLITGELHSIQYFSSQLKVKEPIEPVDLIKPREKPQKGYVNYMLVTTILVGFVFWKRKFFFSLPVFQDLMK